MTLDREGTGGQESTQARFSPLSQKTAPDTYFA
jgi:hypothetical protein